MAVRSAEEYAADRAAAVALESIACEAAATRASFHASISFGLLALAMLFIAGFVVWDRGASPGAMVFAISATVFAYGAQVAYTLAAARAGGLLQFCSLLCGALSFFGLVAAT